jgi:hypothetical protein
MTRYNIEDFLAAWNRNPNKSTGSAFAAGKVVSQKFGRVPLPAFLKMPEAMKRGLRQGLGLKSRPARRETRGPFGRYYGT